jgi:hypothetical protein
VARPRVADREGGLQKLRVAADILNKQSPTADRGGPPAWGLGGGLTTATVNKLYVLRIICKGLGNGLILWHDLSTENGYDIWQMEYQ